MGAVLLLILAVASGSFIVFKLFWPIGVFDVMVVTKRDEQKVS